MQQTAKITPFQFYTLLFLTRVFSLVTYISGIRSDLSTSGEVLSVLLMTVLLFISVLPTVILIKKDPASSVLTRANCISPLFEKAICIVYLAFFIFKGITTASRFELLLGSVMFPETNVQFFVAILLLVSLFCAWRGVEALGRASVIFLIPVLFAFGFVFLTLIKNFDILNFSAIYQNETKGIIDGGIYSVARTSELSVIALFIPYVKNHKVRNTFIWTGLISAVIVVTEVMISGVLGGFGENQLFNMYSMSVIAGFGFIERMDAIISCIWMICATVKIALIFYICNLLLTALTGKNRTKIYTGLTAVAIFTGMMFISLSIISFAALVKSPLMTVLFCLTAIIIPLSVIFGEKIKEKKYEKT